MRAVAEAAHLWVGERFVRIVLNEIVRVVAPAAPAAHRMGGQHDPLEDL